MNDYPNGGDHLDHLFRHSYGKAISVLLARLGTHNLQVVEDALQEALFKAAQVWSFREVPEQPEGWLISVAYRKAIDALRKRERLNRIEAQHDFQKQKMEGITEPLSDREVTDDELQMIFACCHPRLPVESQIILTLKLIAGFGNREVAAILLKKEDTIAKAFTRAKKYWIDKEIKFDIPVEMGLRSRLNIVLKTIYLIFTEGYRPLRGNQIVRRDVCYEAIRLALLLDQNKYCSQSSVKALLALMCFHTSRFDARIDDYGNLMDLRHQNRSKWNQDLIRRGTRYLHQAYADTKVPFDYLLQAYVSYYHCVATHYSETNWQAILDVYDLQMVHNYSPAVELNRIIPFYKVHGAPKAMDLILTFKRNNPHLLKGLFHAIHGELLKATRDFEQAKKVYQDALKSMDNEIERKHIKKKIKELGT